MKGYGALILAATALAGCSQPPLRSGITEMTAVSVTNRSPQTLFQAYAMLDDYDCYGRQSLVYLGDRQRDHTRDLPAKASQTVFFIYLGVDPTILKTCQGAVTVPTKSGAAYRFEFARTATGCTVEAFERQNFAEMPIPVIRRDDRLPAVDIHGPWCSADPRFLGSSALATPRTEADH